MWPNPRETANLVTFTEEILNGKLHFLWSEKIIILNFLFRPISLFPSNFEVRIRGSYCIRSNMLGPELKMLLLKLILAIIFKGVLFTLKQNKDFGLTVMFINFYIIILININPF